MHSRTFGWWLTAVTLYACSTSNSDQSLSQKGFSASDGSVFTIKGSDTVLPLAQEEARKFMSVYPESHLKVIGGGSGVGIAALINNTTDIAMVSRDLNYQEKNSLALIGKNTQRIVLAYDALAIVVHPDNPVKELTIKELELIYTGKIHNWSTLGGPDLPILPYSRETSSGTYRYFMEVAMHDRAYRSDVLKAPNNESIASAVAETPGGIGYVGVAYVSDAVQTVSIYNRTTEDYIHPTIANAQNNTYPIVRPLYFFFLQEDTDRLKPIIDYVLSEEGQKIIEEVGYVPL